MRWPTDMVGKRMWVRYSVGLIMNLELWPELLLDIAVLDFHDKILKQLYFRNGWTDSYVTKGIRIDMIMVNLFDFTHDLDLVSQG